VVFTPWINGSGCQDSDSTAAAPYPATSTAEVCLWPDYGPSGGSTMYTVTLTVSDGTSTASVQTVVPVTGDALPCIDSLNPPDGSYVVDPNSPAPFDTLTVAKVIDDLDPYPVPPGTTTQISFKWTLWRESDPVWRTIPFSGGQYSPDYSVFGVGEHVRIRVEAVDRSGKPASCDVSLDSCAVESCNASPCYQWKTWNLELR
jgi:hypothetical protein